MGIFQMFKERLWFNYRIRKNEFHPSLDPCFEKLCEGGEVAEKEWERVGRLRQLAHEIDIAESDKKFLERRR